MRSSAHPACPERHSVLCIRFSDLGKHLLIPVASDETLLRLNLEAWFSGVLLVALVWLSRGHYPALAPVKAAGDRKPFHKHLEANQVL